MAILDIFNDDAFRVLELSRAITDQPATPGQVSALGIFENDFQNSDIFSLEFDSLTTSLVPAAPRGAPGSIPARARRKMITLRTVHLPQQDVVRADEVARVREFGTEDRLRTVQSLVNRRLAAMRRNIDATLEFQRVSALTGKVLDADGSELVDLYAQFGITAPATITMPLNTASADIRAAIIKKIKRPIETYLTQVAGGALPNGYTVLCGQEFFDKLVGHDNVKDVWQRWQDGEALRNDSRDGFTMAGVTFIEYRSAQGIGGQEFLATDEAIVLPRGVQGLFVTAYAPADYLETVNTTALPYYAKQYVNANGTGINLEAQSNPLPFVTRPQAVRRLKVGSA